jgi:hypothetical protein
MLQILAHRGDALVVEPAKPPGAFGPIGNQPRPEMKSYDATATIKASPEAIWPS